MYLYYFNVDHGRSDEILVARVLETRKCHYDDFLMLRLDGNSDLVRYWTKNQTKRFKEKYAHEGMWKSLPDAAGKIYKRQFWLDNLDMSKARAIIASYERQKIEELRARLKRMEELA